MTKHSIRVGAEDVAVAQDRARAVEWSPRSVVLSDDQRQAVEQVVEWFAGSRQEIRLGGLAGTGKTTIASAIPKALGLTPGEVAYCAYTGKAAQVLSKKLREAGGVQDATTIHRLVYKPTEVHCPRCPCWVNPEATCHRSQKMDCGCRLVFRRVVELPPRLRLIIVDEASMVDEDTYRDIVRFGRRVLWLGDHGQLPPVVGRFNLMETPDIRLERIHRQAEDSAVLRLAMDVREQAFIPQGDCGPGVHVGGTELDLDGDPADWRDQLVLCWKNRTRSRMNAAVRAQLGYTADRPVVGDRVICLRNNYDAGIVNGALGTVLSIEGGPKVYRARIDVDGAREPYEGLVLVKQFGAEHTLNDRGVDLWDYGYCLTVHKAQGSEAERVVVIDEYPHWLKDYRRWLYTAVTRARSEVTVLDG